jgi:chorismate mutase
VTALAHLRQVIAALDESVVTALCARARFRRNDSLYTLNGNPLASLPELARAFNQSATQAGRIHLLRPLYLRLLLPELCEPGADPDPAVCISADSACLDAIARRLAQSVHIATRKREALPPALQRALSTGDPQQVEIAITHEAVEGEVLTRVQTLAAAQAHSPDIPPRLVAIYRNWLIPLSRNIQVHGLLHRGTF